MTTMRDCWTALIISLTACATAPGAEWSRLDTIDFGPFEVAGGIVGPGQRGQWNAPPVAEEDDGYDAGADYRCQIWQGTPAFGVPPLEPDSDLPSGPTMADYGNGLKPTFVRFEVRRGMRPGGGNEYDPWYDERKGDASRPDRNTSGRLRIERSINSNHRPIQSKVSGPDPMKTRRYEWCFYLEPGWADNHVRGANKTTPSSPGTTIALGQLYCRKKTTRSYSGDPISLYATTHSNSSFAPFRTGFTIYTLPFSGGSWSSKELLEDGWIGRWVHVRCDIVWSSEENGSYRLYVDDMQNPVSEAKNVRTWNDYQYAYMKYGIYMTHTAELDRVEKGADNVSSDLHDLADPTKRSLAVWFTGVRFWDDVGAE
jgi:hypothetical protein